MASPKKKSPAKKKVARKSTTTKAVQYENKIDWSAWDNRFNELCYKIFFETEDGKELLSMEEQRYFYGPVAVPGKDISWAHFYEGRNNHVRSYREGAQKFAQGIRYRTGKSK